jgi:hypothetical protein
VLSSFSQVTATGLSRLLDGALSHDTITNFLAESRLGSRELWKLVKKNVRQVESEQGVLIFDDTIEEKPYTDENEIVCYHYDHTKGRHVKGINLLHCLYHSQGVNLPLAFEVIRKDEVFVDPKTQRCKRRARVSKNELLRSMLHAARRNQVQFAYVLTDSWFASNENMRFIKQKVKKDFIMALKSNRLVARSEADKLHGRFVSLEALHLRDDEPQTVYLKGLPFPVLLVKQVFMNKDGSAGILHLVCSDLSLTGSQVQALYHKRWNIEEFHKSIKSNAALAHSPTRVPRTQTNHVFASIYAFVKLERLHLDHQLNHFALKSRLYLHALQASLRELRRLQAAPA